MPAQFDEYTHGVIEINGTTAPNRLRIENLSENPDATTLRKIQSGEIQPSFAATMNLKPKMTFETQEVAKALDLMSVLTEVKGVSITTKATCYWPKKDAIERSSGSDHQVTDVNEGIMVPRVLRWNGENDIWMLGCEILSAYDGTNKPFVFATASLPAEFDMTEGFIGGKWMVNTLEQNCWQQMTYDFGFVTNQRHCTGQPYPGRADVDTAMPFIEAPSLDLPARSVYTLDGTLITQCDVYLRKSNGPVRYADNTLNHIKLASVAGQIRTNQTSGINPAQTVIRADLLKTAAAKIIAYTKNVIIPP